MNFFYKTIVTVSLFCLMRSAHADWWQCNKENVIKTSKIVGASAIFTCAGLRSIHSIMNIYRLAKGDLKSNYKKSSAAIIINDNIFKAGLAAYIAYQTVAYVWPDSVDQSNDKAIDQKKLLTAR